MCEVPLAECCSYKSSCTIRKSSCKILGINDLGTYGLAVHAVMNIEGSKKYKITTPVNYENILHLGLSNVKDYCWFMDDYLYVADSNIEAVNLIAYSQEGIKLVGDDCQCSDVEMDCTNPLDKDFKCPQFLIETVKNMVFEKIFNTYKRSQEDTTSNNLDETK
jgi:hypothetical protein